MPIGLTFKMSIRGLALWLESFGMTGNSFARACRGPCRNRYDIVREAIATVGGMKVGHANRIPLFSATA